MLTRIIHFVCDKCCINDWSNPFTIRIVWQWWEPMLHSSHGFQSAAELTVVQLMTGQWSKQLQLQFHTIQKMNCSWCYTTIMVVCSWCWVVCSWCSAPNGGVRISTGGPWRFCWRIPWPKFVKIGCSFCQKFAETQILTIFGIWTIFRILNIPKIWSYATAVNQMNQL